VPAARRLSKNTAALGSFWNAFTTCCRSLVWPVSRCVFDLALVAFLLQQFSTTCTNWLNTSTFCPSATKRVEQFKQGFRLAGRGVVAHELRVAANLAQARQRREHVVFCSD